jgi:predicted amidohydrolase YtcJ
MAGAVADTVFLGGRVFDGSGSEPFAAGVAVAGSHILGVADDSVIRSYIGSQTRVVDASGGLILPGFVDAHIHPVEAGLEMGLCDLTALSTREQYLEAIGEYAARHPELEWIQGGGWQIAAFPGGAPVASDLDAIVPDRPVFLSNRDRHGSWVNSRALELAGVTADTADPIDGRIERDAAGAPSGTLHEGARMLVSDLIPRESDEQIRAALLRAQGHLFTLGITGWQDAIVGEYGGHTDTGDIYLAAAKDGSLKATVVAALWWDRNRGAEQIPGLVERRAQLVHERFAATTIKIMQDGIPENQTAALTEPYLVPGCDCGGTERGISFVEPEALKRYATELDAEGFQLHLHAIGDRAVRESLDALEAARVSNGPVSGAGDGRHHIAHLQIVDPADVARFADLGVTANLQMLWASYEPQMVEQNIPFLGPERAAWQYPFGDLARSGASLCAGSDWPVTDPNPWAALHVAVNRMLPADSPDSSDVPFFPQQSLSLGQALAAYTSGSNRINHRDATGRIAAGFEADIVLADRDPFSRPADEISQTRVLRTFVRGEEVWAASAPTASDRAASS